MKKKYFNPEFLKGNINKPCITFVYNLKKKMYTTHMFATQKTNVFWSFDKIVYTMIKGSYNKRNLLY